MTAGSNVLGGWPRRLLEPWTAGLVLIIIYVGIAGVASSCGASDEPHQAPGPPSPTATVTSTPSRS